MSKTKITYDDKQKLVTIVSQDNEKVVFTENTFRRLTNYSESNSVTSTHPKLQWNSKRVTPDYSSKEFKRGLYWTVTLIRKGHSSIVFNNLNLPTNF